MINPRDLLVALAVLLLTSVASPSLKAQNGGEIQWSSIKPTRPPAAPPVLADSTPSFYKRKTEWKKIIDEYWGPGVSLQEKQSIFNAYADYIQRYFTAFEGLGISWDSLRTHYYSQITDSTSHGRFSAILSYLAYRLREPHTAALDFSLMSVAVDDSVVIASPSWGKPVWLGGPQPTAKHFGAVLTPATDSSAIVIRALSPHPLGLRPGDIVLGYEGVPWRQIAREFLAAEIPSFALHGGSRSMEMHHLLGCAGFNWHLFDTIDIVKYPAGDTLHLPVDTLASMQMPDVMYNNESLEIPGVPWPDWNWTEEVPNTAPVTHGIVEGTRIGYIYVSLHTWRFNVGNLSPDSDERFTRAVEELWNTDGLIIDLRRDNGGRVKANFKTAFGKLLNNDTHTLEYYRRASGSNLFALTPFTLNDPAASMYIDADEETVYDRPIAVLVGPGCVSVGDATAYRLTYFPNTRFFGKPTSMGWAGADWTGQAPQIPGYTLAASDMVFRDHYDPGRDLERTEFPVDEQVWLTREDVANGEDTVVKRALAWIKNVAHAHDVAVSSRFWRPGIDTLRLTAHVENPNSHAISVKAYFKIASTVVDSAAFSDDGLHGDGTAGDSLWGTSWRLPAGEEMYNAAVVTTDAVDTSVYSMPFSARFTTAGPVVFQKLSARRVSSDLVAFEEPAVHNRGAQKMVPAVIGTIRTLEGDTVISKIYNWRINFGDIPADSIVSTAQFYTLTVNAGAADTVRFALGVDLASNGYTYWTDTLAFVVGPFKTEFADQPSRLPVAYALYQNYPNPFNPTTTIRYDVAGSGAYQSSGQAGGQGAGHVRMAVYDLLGREVAVLLDERKTPGSYEVQFDVSGLASGIYIYRMTAGAFVQTRKLVALK